jgi:hypothetical protein
MIILEREDVDRIGLNPALFYKSWVVGSLEALIADYADVPDPGPFLLKVNDEQAWVSKDGEEWMQAGKRLRHVGVAQAHWSALASLYMESEGLTIHHLTRRLKSVRGTLRKKPGVWMRWNNVYRWPEARDLIWSGLIYHPWLETRERFGEKEIRHVG